MSRRTRGFPPTRPLARRIARPISMGHYQRDLVLGAAGQTICFMYVAVPTVIREVSRNFLQNRWIMWGGAVVIVLIALAVVYGLPGGETPPAQ